MKLSHLALRSITLLSLTSLAHSEQMQSVLKDNLGVENQRVVESDGTWHYHAQSIPLTELAADSPARDIVFSASKLKIAYSGLKKDAKYAVKLTYLSDNPGREQAVYIDGMLVRGQFILPDKKVYEQQIAVTQDAVKDGSIEVTIEKRMGLNAILSEIELLSTDPMLEAHRGADYFGNQNHIHGTVRDQNNQNSQSKGKSITVTATLGEKQIKGDVSDDGSFSLDLPADWLADPKAKITLSCTGVEQDINFEAGVLLTDKYMVEELDKTTHDPFELAVADDGRVFYIERLGKVKMCLPNTRTSQEVGEIKVYSELDDGLLGFALDPNFSKNNWMFFCYSLPGKSENVVARFTLTDGKLDMASEKILLRVPVNRDTPPCHTGGSLAFDSKGNLFVSTGDNINPFASSGFSPSDNRKGREQWDALGSSADTNDLRGKILRITPQANGSYTIPAGNLFAKGVEKTKPEIYVMGCRNPFRIAVDQKTSTLYWGEVGPDSKNTSELGPAGNDEFNQAKKAGNFGWPEFVGDNKTYSIFDFATNQVTGKWDKDAPVNNSPNNKGLNKLPPAQSALMWYPYSASSEFPMLGSGGRCAMGGPVYHFDENLKSPVKLPMSYDNTVFFYDWMRGWIMAGKLDTSENLVKVERFMPETNFKRPMDLELGPDGVLYLIEWGSSYGGSNPDARIVRLVPGVKLNQLNVKEPTQEEKDNALIAKFQNALEGGDIAKGKELFGSPRAGCVYCHASDVPGGIIGPGLSDVGSRLTKQELLDSVVFPSKRIDAQYQSLVVTLNDGKTVAGTMGNETDKTLGVITGDGGEVTLEKSDIKSTDKGISPMPAGVGEAFSPDDMKNIVAFLASLKTLAE